MSRREPNGGLPESLAVEHVCRLPRWVPRAFLGLGAALLLAIVALSIGAVYVYQANQYVQGRGEYRDAEAARIQEENADLTRRTACAILDGLPPSPLLDRLRGQFGCGPGTPIEDMPPEVQEQLAGRAPVVIVPPAEPSRAVTPEPDRMGGAGPNPPRPPAAEPPPPEPRPSPAPSPEPGPRVDLEPITEPVCQLVGVCF